MTKTLLLFAFFLAAVFIARIASAQADAQTVATVSYCLDVNGSCAAPIAGERVRFFVGNMLVSEKTTDESGQVSFVATVQDGQQMTIVACPLDCRFSFFHGAGAYENQVKIGAIKTYVPIMRNGVMK